MQNKYLEKISQQLTEPAQPEHLGIDLSKGEEQELNKWLIAVTLFSRPIQRGVAARASKQLSSEGITTADAVQKAGYPELVQALGRGHYVRYDFSMSDSLLAQAAHLKSKYGTLRNLIDNKSAEEIRQEIQTFQGIGPLGSKLFVEGVTPHLDKYRNTDPAPKLTPVSNRDTRLREALVNGSRQGSFNPYSKDQYDWSQTRDVNDEHGNLMEFHIYDVRKKEFARFPHPDVQKYRLDGTPVTRKN